MKTSPETLHAFQRQQLAFTAYIRDPQNHPLPPGIPQERMQVYVQLFSNGLNDQLSGVFPVLRAISSDAWWEAMLRDFLARHRARTPLFSRIGEEFLDYLQHTREPDPEDWPFLLELAHYEYAELAVAIDATPLPEHDPNGDLLSGHPVPAPSAWNLSYHFPVHRIGPEFLPREPGEQPTQLLVYRDRADGVHFLEITPVTWRLLELLKEKPSFSGLEILKQIATELGHADPQAVITAGTRLLVDLRERNVLLGSR